MRIKSGSPDNGNSESRRSLLTGVINREFEKHGIELGHYFRLLYHIVRFVALTPDTVSDDKEKQNLI